MKQLEINNIAKETVEILKYFDSNFVSKIPNNFLNLLRELAEESNIIVKINKDKKLKEQEISEECKNLISLIYYSYIATEEQKIELKKIWNQNEELYQNKIREKYNPDDIFKKNNENNIIPETSNLPAIIEKENFIKKIVNFFKKIFMKGY